MYKCFVSVPCKQAEAADMTKPLANYISNELKEDPAAYR
jgi:hypothetical protein